MRKCETSKANPLHMDSSSWKLENENNNLITFMPNIYHFTYEFLTLILFLRFFLLWKIDSFSEEVLLIPFYWIHFLPLLCLYLLPF